MHRPESPGPVCHVCHVASYHFGIPGRVPSSAQLAQDAQVLAKHDDAPSLMRRALAGVPAAVDAIGTVTGERMLVPAPAKANDPGIASTALHALPSIPCSSCGGGAPSTLQSHLDRRHVNLQTVHPLSMMMMSTRLRQTGKLRRRTRKTRSRRTTTSWPCFRRTQTTWTLRFEASPPSAKRRS